ncbi:TIGR02996 domain-containing protein [Gemmata sp. G18]|uniref:TIGR02996 domain-containing protein n=1 Tax=Gemmata palustris TaxID=2822762 RepID=A0ABS5BP42_9BACT|nr:TIGR02996 domain-containing protein [Gemmata palustris]MBP3955495.1 TIGR02996 domain-containing protein [Gemmata palustris]
MNDETAFLDAIEAQPQDPTARLVYADWLDEHDRPLDGALERVLAEPERDDLRLVYASVCEQLGDSARAEFVRAQCQLEGHPQCGEERDCANANSDKPKHLQRWCSHCAPVADLRAKEFDSFRAKNCCWEWTSVGEAGHSWAYNLRERFVTLFSTSATSVTCFFSRGFVETITCSAASWLLREEVIRATHPVRAVNLTSGLDWYAEAGEGIVLQTGQRPIVARTCRRATRSGGWSRESVAVERLLETEWPCIKFEFQSPR